MYLQPTLGFAITTTRCYLSLPRGATRNEMSPHASVSTTLSQSSTTLALILSHYFLQIDFTRVHLALPVSVSLRFDYINVRLMTPLQKNTLTSFHIIMLKIEIDRGIQFWQIILFLIREKILAISWFRSPTCGKWRWTEISIRVRKHLNKLSTSVVAALSVNVL